MGGYVLSKELINRILEEIGLESIGIFDDEHEIDDDIVLSSINESRYLKIT